ncbi:hypothetical protein AVMA1855_20000 [Acidovorax sp. SUPP1855]|uniref:hypothetical protein n=1 Tax=Acidovorax sp. SUPP1855 TaxID=431774 RepID=UPI0023DE4EE0|nr:hypothetical protein [Acidovorax sp. SUPP1855]GKS86474.1 hypothetical protein AVMA1855_20000 [Acidovorax sp. SUPP1855]
MVYQPNQIPDEASSALAAAFAHSYSQTADEWVDRCRKDLAQLWRRGDLWAITEVLISDGMRVLRCIAMAGPYDPALKDEIEQWGRSVGCRKAIIEGRKGWSRKHRDYSVKAVTLEKEL